MDTSKRIRVMLVDDHEMVISGLTHFIHAQDDLELVGQASNGVEALEICPLCNPDVILMDLMMPDMDGVEAIRRVHQQYPKIQVVALTSFTEQGLVQQALSAGAIGFILKNTSVDELSAAIRAAYQGKPTLAPEAFKLLVNGQGECKIPGENLTNREGEVLALMVQGYGNQQIAQHLVLNLSTVKTHVSNILSKLGVTNRVEAVALALQNNLVRPT